MTIQYHFDWRCDVVRMEFNNSASSYTDETLNLMEVVLSLVDENAMPPFLVIVILILINTVCVILQIYKNRQQRRVQNEPLV